MKNKKAIGCLFAFTALVASGITFSGVHRQKELTAEDLPESELYVAPAGVTPAYSYQNSPTNEPWYSENHYFTNSADPVQPHSYAFNQRDTTYSRMNVPSVWNSYRGEGVKVAVIDTGCKSTHADFSTTNFTLSKNAISGSTTASAWDDTSGHGTASAATIAAAINSVGGSGIAPNVQLIVLKCVDSSNSFNISSINNALQYCIDNGVDVINMSIQGYNVSQNFNASYYEDWGEFQYNTTSQGIIAPSTFSTKLNACYSAGITVVASAGNFNTNKESYPAANDHVIAVGSTGMKEANKYNKAGFSNYGTWVDISAPGYVTSPYITDNIPYTVQYGTSFSAPLVTGAVALFKSKYPYAKPDQIETALKETAYSINWQGGGAINVAAFLDYVPVESITLTETEKTIYVGDSYQLASTISPSSATNKNLTYYSADESVCTVSDSGLITAVGTGQALVEVASEEDSHVGEVITVTVEEEPDPYYEDIGSSLDGDDLLAALRTLNSKKKTKNVGYSSMGTTPSGQFKYTDYDTSTVQYDDKGQPYGTKIISFYSGTSTSSFNREHVWPNTHGGNIVENDIHMPRPTLASENGSRGHSFFVEGMKSNNDTGWDPAMESFGEETYRGDSARIIFYSMIATDQLTLVDDQSRSSLTNNKEMGVISDMLSWNLRYPVLDRERRRNEGAEYLQGNRNPFIDHPEYACKIWGDLNDNTREVCGIGRTLLSLTVSGTPNKTTYEDGDSFVSTGLTVTAHFDDETSPNVTSSVVWTPNPLTQGTTSVTGTYTYGSVSKTVTINGITVNEKSSSEDDGGTYVKVTSNLSDWTGKYLLVYENSGGNKAWSGADSSSAVNVTISNNSIEKPSNAASLTVSPMTNGYSIKINSNNDNNGKYISGTSGSNTTIYNSTVQSNTISYSSGSTSITSNTSVMRYNTSASLFRYYKSSSYSQQAAVQLYKLDESTPKVNSISIDSSLSLDVYNNKTYTFVPTINADEGADTTVTWSSSDSTVASINNSGKVTALKAGSATITATCGGKSATCSVTVTDSTPAAVTGVSLNKSSTTLTVGGSETLTATITPSNASNKSVTWTSSNTNVATVSGGTVNAVAQGSATITVTTVDGGYTATCTVTVNAAPVITYQLEADVSEVPFNSGTNHNASVGVKVYEYTNGVKGSSVAQGNVNVNTTSLGRKTLEYTYNSTKYYTNIKVTNNGTSYSEQTLTPHSTTFYLSNDTGKKFTSSNTTAQGWTVNLGGTTNVEASQSGSIGYNKFGSSKSSFSSLIFNYSLNNNDRVTSVAIKCQRSGTELSSNLVAYTLDTNNTRVYMSLTSVKNNSGTELGTSTLVPSNSTVSYTNMYTFTFGPAANTNHYGTVYIGIDGSSNGKQLSVNTLACSYSTVSGADNDFTFEEQASAWATYFISETRTSETCLAEEDSQKLAGLQSKWVDLAYEYSHMVDGAKDEFCTSADTTIIEARAHYLYIISKFGAENLGTDGAFVKDSHDNVLNAKQNNPISILVENPSTALIVVLSLVSVSAIGLYFYVRKRKED